MTFNPEVSSINQRLQFGLESTPGTGVAANKLLQCYDLQFAPEADTNQFTPTGRKYPSIVIENSEWSSAAMTGILDYNGIVYALSGVAGAATSITAHGASTTAKDWVFNPPLTGSVQPQTYTIEHGDSAIASTPFKVNYGLFTELGYKGDRKSGFTVSGKLLAQNLQTAITMTNSPTAIAIQPSAGKHFNVYLDPTSGALGTTQLLKVLSLDYAWSNLYGPFFPLNRANLGWTAHVDLKPTCTMKLMLEADTTGLNTILGYLQSSQTYFMRVDGLGLVIDNNQTGTITGTPTGGTFTLTYKGQTTAGIAYNANGATVQTAFQLLSTVGTNCTVSGGAGGPYVFSFTGTLANDTTAMTASGAGLTGGSSPTITITQTQVYAEFKHDLAVKASKPNPFKDDNGVYAIEWDFTVIEDSGWNKSQLFTVTNLLTAL